MRASDLIQYIRGPYIPYKGIAKLESRIEFTDPLYIVFGQYASTLCNAII